MKIAYYVFNSHSNTANIEQSSSRNSTKSAFSTVSKYRNQNQYVPKHPHSLVQHQSSKESIGSQSMQASRFPLGNLWGNRVITIAKTEALILAGCKIPANRQKIYRLISRTKDVKSFNLVSSGKIGKIQALPNNVV
jgi:hypothetical protein